MENVIESRDAELRAQLDGELANIGVYPPNSWKRDAIWDSFFRRKIVELDRHKQAGRRRLTDFERRVLATLESSRFNARQFYFDCLVDVLTEHKHNWQVSLGNGRITSRLYSYRSARLIAQRYNRLFRTDAAYAVR